MQQLMAALQLLPRCVHSIVVCFCEEAGSEAVNCFSVRMVTLLCGWFWFYLIEHVEGFLTLFSVAVDRGADRCSTKHLKAR